MLVILASDGDAMRRRMTEKSSTIAATFLVVILGVPGCENYVELCQGVVLPKLCQGEFIGAKDKISIFVLLGETRSLQ